MYRAMPVFQESLRVTPPTRPVPGGLSGGSARKQRDVVGLRERDRTDRAAIDPGRYRGDEESPIEPRVPAVHGLPADVGSQFRVGVDYGRVYHPRQLSKNGRGIRAHDCMLGQCGLCC